MFAAQCLALAGMATFALGDASPLFAILQLIGILLLPALAVGGIVALLSLWLFGGARRNGLALCSTGFFCLVTGALFQAPFFASYYAQMDNAYLDILFVGWWFVVLGATLLVGSLAGFGVNRWLALVLWVALTAAGFYQGQLAKLFALSGGTPFVLYAALVVGIVAVLLLARGHWLALVRGILLGGTAAAAVLVLYGFGRQQIIIWGYSGPEAGFYKPPFVDFPEIIASLALGVALFLVARAWGKPPSPAEPLTPGPAVPTPYTSG